MSFQASIARNRRLLKLFVSTHVLSYRFSRGALGARFHGLPVLLLATIGRKSGNPQTVPVVYMKDEDRFIISPGLVHCPGWYLNLKNEPDATVQIGPRTIRVRASEADPTERDRLWSTVPPYWNEYQKTYPGPIPLLVLRPIP